MSLPCASGTMPDATALAAPPLDPPAVRSGLHGLFVRPCRSLSVVQRNEKPGVLLRPTTIAPARRSLRTTGASAPATASASAAMPPVVARPGLVGVHLDRDGHAVQRPERRAGRGAARRRRGRPAAPRRRAPRRGVERRVDVVDPAQAGLDGLPGRDPAGGGGPDEVGDRPLPQVRACSCWCSWDVLGVESGWRGSGGTGRAARPSRRSGTGREHPVERVCATRSNERNPLLWKCLRPDLVRHLVAEGGASRRTAPRGCRASPSSGRTAAPRDHRPRRPAPLPSSARRRARPRRRRAAGGSAR